MAKKRIHSLDSIRGISSLVVVIFHALLLFTIFHEANYEQVYENGFWKAFFITPLNTVVAGLPAILIFFTLSGFVLALPFLNNRYPGYWPYMVKRFCRIYIPFIILMIISTIVMTLFIDYKSIVTADLSPKFDSRWNHHVTFESILAYIFMISYDTSNVNGVVWTLYHEMRVSIIFPLLMIPFLKYDWKKSLVVSGAAVLTIFVVLRGLVAFVNIESFQFLMHDLSLTAYYSIFFVMGAFLAKIKDPITKRIRSLNAPSIAGLLLLSLVLINHKWVYEIFEVHELAMQLIPLPGILLLFSLVLSVSKFDHFLSIKPLLWLGKISYSLYLVHIPVIMLSVIFLSMVIPMWAAIIISPILALPVAAYAHKLVEVPAINIGQKLSKKIQNKNLKDTVIREEVAERNA